MDGTTEHSAKGVELNTIVCAVHLRCVTHQRTLPMRERERNMPLSKYSQETDTDLAGLVDTKGLMGWNLEILLLTCQVLNFLPLEALHLLALYGDPWNDFGGLFWSSPPFSCGAVNSSWDKAMRKQPRHLLACKPAQGRAPEPPQITAFSPIRSLHNW